MLNFTIHYDCDLDINEKIEKKKLYRHTHRPNEQEIHFTTETTEQSHLIYIGFYNINRSNRSERRICFDKTSENNQELKTLKRFLKKYYNDPDTKLDIEVIRYQKIHSSIDPKIVGYSINTILRDIRTNEIIMQPYTYNFWNTRTHPLFKQIELVNLISYGPKQQVKYPSNYTINLWLRMLTYNINLYSAPVDIICNLFKVMNINTKYPLDLKRALVEYYKEELKYGYMLTYEKYPSNRTRYDYVNLNRSLILIAYRCLTEYQPGNEKFSYAFFMSKCYFNNIKTMAYFQYLIECDYRFYSSLKEQYISLTFHKICKSYFKEEEVIKYLKINCASYLILSLWSDKRKCYNKLNSNLKHFLKIKSRAKFKKFTTQMTNQIKWFIEATDAIHKSKTQTFIEPFDYIEALLKMLAKTYPNTNTIENLKI